MKTLPKKCLLTMHGTIVEASRIQDFLTLKGQKRQRAMLHIRENAEDDPYNAKYFYVTHSEMNAILNYRGGSLEGSKLYVTLFPCNECAKAIIQSGIRTIIYADDKYKDLPATRASRRMLDAAGVRYYPYHASGREIKIRV